MFSPPNTLKKHMPGLSEVFLRPMLELAVSCCSLSSSLPSTAKLNSKGSVVKEDGSSKQGIEMMSSGSMIQFTEPPR